MVSAVLGPIHTVEVEGITHTIAREEGGVVRAPAPAVIVSVAVSPGDEVAVGDPLVVLESMKMETTVTAAFPGRVSSVLVAPNVQVGTGVPLLKLEPLIVDEARVSDGAVELDFGIGANDDWQPADALRAYLLGYDLDAASTQQITRGDDPFAALGFDRPERLRAEDEILHLFADLCAISRRRPEPAEEETGEQRAST